ncbi:MAG: hypothetical protein CBB68_07845 [Rhodospirillaceae bacterium TMED8]|nr:hypothetical protein [Magnetovibrio sp.]OUT50889.1 MAG: hypothetical protein CBB68_07845 [Rhodospirillaceae bacterium TMED8]
MKIGIDLGGTKIEAIVIQDNGKELNRVRMDTPVGNYYDTIIAIRDLVKDLTVEHKIQLDVPVGIGIPGSLSPATGLVKNSNSTCLTGMPLDEDLSRVLQRPVRIANDADCFAVSEAYDGAGKGANSVFGVILGTGVGGGIVINGKLWPGRNRIAGEWGHLPLPWSTPSADNNASKHETKHKERKCYCGKSRCIETYLSGPALEADFKVITGTNLKAADIAKKCDLYDPAAVYVMARYEHRLARALASVINVLDPDVIVLGGGLSNIHRLYDTVPLIWQDWVFSDHCATRLVQNIHGDSSGVRGAAWLW